LNCAFAAATVDESHPIQRRTAMAKGQLRSNKEKKKPKQDKTKKAAPVSPFAAIQVKSGTPPDNK
jgi:hypothetical protein